MLAYMMLTGFALECAVKGLLVKQKPELVRAGALPSWPTRSGHDLPGLFRAVGVPLSAPEKELLQRLREFVEWRGRYPIPARAEQLMPREAVPGGGTPFLMPSSDRRLTEGLLARLEGLLDIQPGEAPAS
jgi:hypothetical protein